MLAQPCVCSIIFVFGRSFSCLVDCEALFGRLPCRLLSRMACDFTRLFDQHVVQLSRSIVLYCMVVGHCACCCPESYRGRASSVLPTCCKRVAHEALYSTGHLWGGCPAPRTLPPNSNNIRTECGGKRRRTGLEGEMPRKAECSNPPKTASQRGAA